MTSGSSELEKVGSIFLQVSLWSVAMGRVSTWLKVIQSWAWWHRLVNPRNQEVRTAKVQGQFGLHEALSQIVFINAVLVFVLVSALAMQRHHNRGSSCKNTFN